MTYRQTAQHLAAQGRNGDTMLVHMNPREVAGLQYLAEKYGSGGFTINPHTGLPEAFNFMKFMPMIAGAALAPFTGGLTAAALVGGATAATTGNLKKGLMAGLGAYGGAGISEGLMGAANAVGSGAPTVQGVVGASPSTIGGVGGSTGITAYQAPGADISGVLGNPANIQGVTGAARDSFLQANPWETTFNAPFVSTAAPPGISVLPQTSPVVSSPLGVPSTMPVSPASVGPVTGGTEVFTKGIPALTSEAGRAGFIEGMKSMPYSTTASLLSSALALTPKEKPYEEPKDDFNYVKAAPYKRNYVANPNPLQDREWQYFQPNALYVREGGITSLAKGGLEDGGFVLRASTVNGLGNGDTNAGQRVAAAKLNARPIRGSGDGMSDSIPTTIGGRREALISSGEAYVPRSQVARLGNGDIQKGADKLYKMMDRVEQARTGKKKAPKQINPNKFIPA